MPDESKPGLRERKKLATWRAIQSTALRLIAERGYEVVSVDDIAAAAGVSRSTFFNYFASKEAVVFDPDPQEPQMWQEILSARPAGEPLWTSLEAIFTAGSQMYSDRLAVQKQLKAASPTLAESARDSSDQFIAVLRSWVEARPFHGDDEKLSSTLMFNCALAASLTAYTLWNPDDGYAAHRHMLATCLAETGKGFAPRRPASSEGNLLS